MASLRRRSGPRLPAAKSQEQWARLCRSCRQNQTRRLSQTRPSARGIKTRPAGRRNDPRHGLTASRQNRRPRLRKANRRMRTGVGLRPHRAAVCRNRLRNHHRCRLGRNRPRTGGTRHRRSARRRLRFHRDRRQSLWLNHRSAPRHRPSKHPPCESPNRLAPLLLLSSRR